MIELNRNLSLLKRSGIRRYTNLAKTVPGCVMLTIGEPDGATPEDIKASAAAALANDRTHYAPNQGVEALRKALAAYETGRGLPCTSEQILITAGATGALFTALVGVLNPGDEVIVPTPAFPLYESLAIIAGAKFVPLDISKTDFQITEEALAQVMTSKTKAIVLNSPNNPTGAVLNEASLAAVKKAVLGKPIFVICDNVYQGLADGDCPDLSTDADLAPQLLLCQSFSKPWAMTGWRVGYLVGPADVMEKLLLLNAAAIAAVPTFLQDGAVTALTTPTAEMAALYRRRREYVCRRLSEMGLSYPAPKGAFYVFPSIEAYGLDDETFCTRMITEAAVAAVPGSCFGCAGHIRISYCCSDEALKTGLDRLEQFLNSLK